jgi:cell division protein FtsL
MLAVIATAAIVAAVAMGVLLVAIVRYARRMVVERDRERDEQRDLDARWDRRLTAERAEWVGRSREQMVSFEDGLDAMRAEHASEIERLRGSQADEVRRAEARHEEEMNRLVIFHATQVEKLMNTATYGGQAGRPAQVSEAEPDAELRVRHRIQEESVEAGALALKDEYERAGIHVTLEEVREEARSMLLGVRPREDVTPVPLLVRDGAENGA